MAITPFIFAPFGNPSQKQNSPECCTELSFTKNFDINKPAVMVFFAHGHSATLERDIVKRQSVLRQLEKAGMNAVLVAPQLAYDQPDSSAGRFKEQGFAKKFFDEAAMKLAQMHDQQKFNTGRPSKQTMDAFKQLPIMMVSYSGGYGATFAIMEQAMRDIPKAGLPIPNAQPSLGERIKGAVLLDTLYGGADVIKRFATQPHRPFVVSNYIENRKNNAPKYTNHDLQHYFASKKMLANAHINDAHNVKIYEERTVGHTELVEKGMTRALQYVPGYRHEAPSVIAKNDVQKDPSDPKVWSFSTKPKVQA